MTGASGVLLMLFLLARSTLVPLSSKLYLCLERTLLDNFDDDGGGGSRLDEDAAAIEEEEDDGEDSVDMASFEVTEAVPTVGEAEMLSRSSWFSLADLISGVST